MINTIVQHQFAVHTGIRGFQWTSSIPSAKAAAGFHCSARSWPHASKLSTSSSPSRPRAATGTSRSGALIQTESPARIDADLASPFGFLSSLRSIQAAFVRGRSPTTHGTATLGSNSSASSSTVEHPSPARGPGDPWIVTRLAHRFLGGVAQLARAPHRPACLVDEEVGVFESLRLHGRYNGSSTGSSVVERPASIAKLEEARFESRSVHGQPGRDSFLGRSNPAQESEAGFNFPTVLRHCLVSRLITAEASVVLAGQPAWVAQVEERLGLNSGDAACDPRPVHSRLGSSTGAEGPDRMDWVEALQPSQYGRVMKWWLPGACWVRPNLACALGPSRRSTGYLSRGYAGSIPAQGIFHDFARLGAETVDLGCYGFESRRNHQATVAQLVRAPRR